MKERRFVILHPDGIPQIWEGTTTEQPPQTITVRFTARGVTYVGADLTKLTDRAAYYVPRILQGDEIAHVNT